MIITYGQAKTLLAKYASKAGTCPTSPVLDLFVKKVIQQLLYRGANGNLRKWVFNAPNGLFTAPPDLEIPEQVRIDTRNSSHAGLVYDKWYEFYDQSTLKDCIPWEEGIAEEINPYFTAYDLPKGGANIRAVAFCKEDAGAHFVIQGRNCAGREVYMPHKGEKFHGEYLSIDKDCSKLTNETFTSISGITKTPTNGYVRLYWYCAKTGNTGLLGEYKPSDTHPSYRRFRILANNHHGLQENCTARVTLLGRVRFVDNYADNDIIPITNIRVLELMAQTMQAEDNNNLSAAGYKQQSVLNEIENENQYKRPAQAQVNFESTTSPGSIKNMI